MSKKEMTLKMRILAMGDQALKTIKAVGEAMKTTFSAMPGAFSMLGKMTSAIFSPLKYIAGAGLGLGAVFGGIVIKSVQAAAGAQVLYDRLKAVFGTEKDAKRAYDALQKYAHGSDFSDEQLAESIMMMKQFGMASPKNLAVVASAARATNSSIEDMTKSIMTLQMRGLKSYGISMESKGDKTVFEYLDKNGKKVEVIAKNLQEARAAVMGIFTAKFGASIAPTTFSGFIQNIRNNIDEAFEDFGGPLLKKLEPVVKQFAKWFQGALESGKFEEWGTAVAGKIEAAFVWAKSVIEYAKGVFDALGKQGPAAWADAFNIIFTAGADIIGNGILYYLKGAGQVFYGIGQMISAAFVQEILKLRLPGMEAVRNRVAGEVAAGMSKQEYAEFVKTQNVGLGGYTEAQRNYLIEKGLPQMKARQMGAGIENVKSGLVDTTAEFDNYVQGRMGQVRGDLEGVSAYKGPSFASIQEKNKKEGMTINIGTLNVQANDEKQMQDRILTKAGTPALAVAGT